MATILAASLMMNASLVARGLLRRLEEILGPSRGWNMALPAKRTPLCLAIGLLGLLACGESPSAPTPTLYDGTWRGTTSQTCPGTGGAPCAMVFTVASNKVTAVYTTAAARVAADPLGRVLCDSPVTGSTTGIGEGCLDRRGGRVPPHVVGLSIVRGRRSPDAQRLVQGFAARVRSTGQLPEG